MRRVSIDAYSRVENICIQSSRVRYHASNMTDGRRTIDSRRATSVVYLDVASRHQLITEHAILRAPRRPITRLSRKIQLEKVFLQSN